jgi:hypothetical protein
MVSVVQSIPYTHRSKPAEEDTAINAIPIANDIARRLSPPVCLGQLAGNPFRARMRGYTQPQETIDRFAGVNQLFWVCG